MKLVSIEAPRRVADVEGINNRLRERGHGGTGLYIEVLVQLIQRPLTYVFEPGSFRRGFKSTPSAPITCSRCFVKRSRSRNIVLQPRHS